MRAGIVKKPWQWPWSSALAHTDKKDDYICIRDFLEIINMSCDSWKRYIDYREADNFLQDVRKHTSNGHPLGTSVFIEKLESEFCRKLHPLPIGRPRKS